MNKYTDWGHECELLKQYLSYKINIYINIIKQDEEIRDPSFNQRTKGYRKVYKYKESELNFDQWKVYIINKIPFRKPKSYLI